MIVKIHEKNSRIIVAICDDDLLGRRFEEGEKQLDLTGSFFDGKKLPDMEVGDIARNADIINFVGKKSVEFGIEEGLVEKENIQKIKDVPFAQVVQEQ